MAVKAKKVQPAKTAAIEAAKKTFADYNDFIFADYRGMNEVAKTLFDFTKDAPTLNVKGGFIGKEIYDAAKISEFSKIPGKKTLIAMLMSAINGPARQLAATLQAYVDKKAAGGDASPSAPVTDAPKAEAAAETPKAEEAPAAAAEAPKADAAPASEAPKADAAPAEKPAEGTAEAPKADAAPEA